MEEQKIHIPKALEKKLKALAPEWFNKLNAVCWNRLKLKDDDANTITDNYSCCLIGEIHGFTDEYRRYSTENNPEYCDDCAAFAKEVIAEFKEPEEKVLVEFLKRMVKHFEKKHPTFFNVPVQMRHPTH